MRRPWAAGAVNRHATFCLNCRNFGFAATGRCQTGPASAAANAQGNVNPKGRPRFVRPRHAAPSTYLTGHWHLVAAAIRDLRNTCQGLHNAAFLPYGTTEYGAIGRPSSIDGRNGLTFWIVSPCREDECKDC